MASGTVAVEMAPGPRVLAITVTGRSGSGAHQHEVHARLDPREPAVAAALASWRRAPLSGDALAELGRAASTSAAVDVRDYAVGEDSSEIGGQVGLGPGLGATLGKGLSTARLTAQRSRPVGGVWEQRLDCGLAS